MLVYTPTICLFPIVQHYAYKCINIYPVSYWKPFGLPLIWALMSNATDIIIVWNQVSPPHSQYCALDIFSATNILSGNHWKSLVSYARTAIINYCDFKINSYWQLSHPFSETASIWLCFSLLISPSLIRKRSKGHKNVRKEAFRLSSAVTVFGRRDSRVLHWWWRKKSPKVPP